jgi:hypothetical protein
MSEPDIARDGGPFSVNEALAALDFHMAKAEKRGDYGCHSDLKLVGDLIETLQECIDELRSAGAEVMRRAMAAKESLTRLP